ncbi:MAG: solute carrier family 23 protein [Actinomycetes bacterium]
MSLFSWTLHGDGKSIRAGEVVQPEERLTWPRTIGIGVQHIVAMFGATFLVPILTHLPPTTTLFFSGVGTMLFLLITRNKLPSYLGSSFAFLAPIAAAVSKGGMAQALGGVVATGVLLAIVGLIVNYFGINWINWLLPPVVTGSIVMIIGLNLAGAAKNNFSQQPLVAIVTLLAVMLIGAVTKGFFSRISIFGGVVVGYLFGIMHGDVKMASVTAAKWLAMPHFTSPSFKMSAMVLFLPVVLVLMAENVGHIKAVSVMTGKNLDDQVGKALFADGLSTTLAGIGGGSGTTTYAENIGTMAASRIYSTAAYWIAALGAVLLSLCPKFGAILSLTPVGVLGGVGLVLYGMIAVLGAKIWIESKVNFGITQNLMVVAATLIIGVSDMSWTHGNYTFTGIVNGTLVAVVGYRVFNGLAKMVGNPAE